MREIKFKAWDKKMNKMRIVESIGFGKPYYSHEGYPVVNMIGRDCINNKDIIIHRDSHQCELMQYTGLKDKNGKEIYEGDILERKFTGLGYELGNRTFVSWDKYRYVQNWIMNFEKNLKDNKDLGTWIKNITPQKLDLDTHLEDFEVVGNIYENPELLEVEE